MLSKLKLITTLGCLLNFMRDGREKKEKLKLLNKIVLLEFALFLLMKQMKSHMLMRLYKKSLNCLVALLLFLVNAAIFRGVGDNGSFAFDDNNLDFENCNILEVIMFLQNLAKSPNGSKMNRTFTEHIIKALMHAREEKLKLEASDTSILHHYFIS